jgi:hypothetical protein
VILNEVPPKANKVVSGGRCISCRILYQLGLGMSECKEEEIPKARGVKEKRKARSLVPRRLFFPSHTVDLSVFG